MRTTVFEALAEAARSSEPVTLGIISGAKGSSPQKVGAKALFYADGRIQGTLGGGCLEAEVQHRALDALRTGKAATFELLLDHDFGWDDGLICGGKVLGLILPNAQDRGAEFWTWLGKRETVVHWGVTKEFVIAASPSYSPAHPPVQAVIASSPNPLASDWLYRETISPQCALWIAGAGHIAQAVAPLALQLDFSVTVFDDRPALVSPQFFPRGVSLQADTWERLLASPLPGVPAFGLIVTRGHRHDALVLQDWVHKPFLFLGMIGSARKARTIFEHFIQEKLATPEEVRRVACPVGIRIRSQTVAEIAVSIMAQFIDKRAELVREQPSAAARKVQLVER
jgi:xanthine dehydrogenase accessory factor